MPWMRVFEFENRRQMTLLLGRTGAEHHGEGVDEQQVVSLDGEGRPLDEMAEVSDGIVDSE